VGNITAREVAKAILMAKSVLRPPEVYSQYWTGVMMIPPPMPSNGLMKPMASPVTRRMMICINGMSNLYQYYEYLQCQILP